MAIVDVSSLTAQQRARFEERRARDFYRFYEAITALSDTPQPRTDLHDSVATALHQPCSSPDKALTAFCQLVALRLAARRSMLFFFDKDNAYVMAEATRTLSLINDHDHDIEDSLWLGHTIIPRGFSVCEHTVNIPSANTGSNQTADNASVIHIINDLTGDAKFCDRPYVTAGPRARFYAGVPITTPDGNRIGALCVLDDKPRDGLSDKSISFMTDMAITIMSHLESTRAKLDQKRGMGMFRDLGSFMDQALTRRGIANGADGRQPSCSEATQDEAAVIDAPRKIDPRVAPKLDPGVSRSNLGRRRRSSGRRRAPKNSVVSDDDIKSDGITQKVRETFQHAAQLMQSSIAVDGVVFLDASANRFAGVVKKGDTHQQGASGAIGGQDTFSTTISDLSNDDAPYTFESPNVPCAILGAQVDTHQASPEQLNRIPEKLLRRLLRAYPHGKTWSFEAGSDLSSAEDVPSELNANDAPDRDPAARLDGELPSAAAPRRRRKPTTASDVKWLQRIFPEAKNLAMVGIRDLSCSKWFAAAFVWTKSSLRVMSANADMNYIAAFCDVIMAEVNRIDAQQAEKAKSTFISSISHELRSPLHGILGTVECLADLQLDSEAADLVGQVETCGRTLLDIINHLLDYSKINSSTDSLLANNIGEAGAENGVMSTSHRGSKGSTSLEACVDLGRITEEIVDTAVYSYFCVGGKTAPASHPVKIIIDIDNRPEVDWTCNIALGAWTRVCLNIVNNALKYTTDGYIVISLKRVMSSHNQVNRRKGVVLRVADTGCGMSTSFLENNLFKAYSQENELSDGIGLGLNLVAKIMRSFRGRVEIQSQKNVGTVVEAHMPLENSREASQKPKSPFDTTIGLVSVGTLGSLAQSNQKTQHPSKLVLYEGLRKTFRELGISLKKSSWESAIQHHVNIVLEDDVPELSRRLQHLTDDEASGGVTHGLGSIPLIVLCYSLTSLRLVANSNMLALHKSRSRVEMLTQPYGPQKLTRALRACLEADLSGSVNSEKHQLLTNAGGATLNDPTYNKTRVPDCASGHSEPSVLAASPRILTETPSASSPGFKVSPILPEGFPFPVTNGSRIAAPPTPEYVPLQDPFSQRPQAPASIQPSKERTPPLSPVQPVSLLLVDDNRINLQILIAYAKKNNHQKLISSNGAEAVDAYIKAADAQLASCQRSELAPSKPQVILMDINMPLMDGFEATRRIRAYESQQKEAWGAVHPPMSPATIIAITGLGSGKARKQGLACGMDLFLTKPVRLKELTTILADVSARKIG